MVEAFIDVVTIAVIITVVVLIIIALLPLLGSVLGGIAMSLSSIVFIVLNVFVFFVRTYEKITEKIRRRFYHRY